MMGIEENENELPLACVFCQVDTQTQYFVISTGCQTLGLNSTSEPIYDSYVSFFDFH